MFGGVVAIDLPPDSGERKALQVPEDFRIHSVDSSTTLGAGYVSLGEEQKSKEMMRLQHVIRDFVAEFLQGVYLDAVMEDGAVVPCRCSMDQKLTCMTLQVDTAARRINLTSVQEIVSGSELRDLRVSTPLDENCVTLVMTNDECVSFKFSGIQAREHFATCMKVLRLALD